MQNILYKQQKQQLKATEDATVRQDKSALPRDRIASEQPASPRIPPRSHDSNNKPHQIQREIVLKRRTVPLSLWVKPVVKAELERQAEKNGLSVSATGGAILERAMQQSVDMEYGALLEPIIRQEIRRGLRTYSSRIALLLVRVAFASEQTRNLVTNVLAKQPGVTPEILEHILDASADAAKGKITVKTPQLEKILKQVESWFTEEPNVKEG